MTKDPLPSTGPPDGDQVRTVTHEHGWDAPSQFGSRWYRSCEACSHVQVRIPTAATRANVHDVGEHEWRDTD
jgi:hypothetical protein